MVAAVVTAACLYRAGGALPDPACTPGATYIAVTQRTIHKTICVKGWTTTIRPSASVTEPQKFASMRQYGIPTSPGHAGLYEYDHLIPLELGGAPDDARNLWPQSHATSYLKDRTENRLRMLVCTGQMTLSKARRIMRTDWRTAP